MALELTYMSLTAMIQTWLEDNDSEFTVALDNIIGLAELRVLRDLDLEIFDKTEVGTLGVGSQNVIKPLDIIALRSFHFTDSSNNQQSLTRKTYDYIISYWKNSSLTSTPLYFTEYNEAIWKIAPTPDLGYSYVVRYNARPSGLSSSNDKTWLGNNVADLLFKACIIEGEKYLKEDPSDGGRVARFESDYNTELPKAKRELLRMQRSDYRPIAPITTPQD